MPHSPPPLHATLLHVLASTGPGPYFSIIMARPGEHPHLAVCGYRSSFCLFIVLLGSSGNQIQDHLSASQVSYHKAIPLAQPQLDLPTPLPRRMRSEPRACPWSSGKSRNPLGICAKVGVSLSSLTAPKTRTLFPHLYHTQANCTLHRHWVFPGQNGKIKSLGLRADRVGFKSGLYLFWTVLLWQIT